MNKDKIIKLLRAKGNNNPDLLIGYRLLRKKYWYLPLWAINKYILKKHNIRCYFIYNGENPMEKVYLGVDIESTSYIWYKL